MKLKLDDKGNPVLVDGHPVYVHDDGKELPIDVPQLYSSVQSRAEQSRRVEAENKEMKDKLKVFEVIKDPAAAIKALEVVANLDTKQLVAAGEVESIKAGVTKALEAQMAEVKKALEAKNKELSDKNAALESQYRNEKIGGSFARSKLIAEKFAIPSDLVQAKFGHHFVIEEGDVVAHDASGNKLYSRANPGKLAGFEEALEILVDGYEHKANILKGTGAAGGGAGPSGTGANGGKRVVTRAQFEALPPMEQATVGRDKNVVIQ